MYFAKSVDLVRSQYILWYLNFVFFYRTQVLQSIHSFFWWCKTTKTCTRDQNLKSLFIFEGVRVEKLKGGLTRLRFWSLAIKIICNNKSKIVSLSVQPFIMKMKRTFYWSPTFYWSLIIFAEKEKVLQIFDETFRHYRTVLQIFDETFRYYGTVDLWNCSVPIMNKDVAYNIWIKVVM